MIWTFFTDFGAFVLGSRMTKSKSLTGDIMSTLGGLRNGSRVVTALGTIRDI